MERILKQTVGKSNKSADGGMGEIINEISVVMKRIEYLEQQNEDRDRQSFDDHGPCKREIKRLAQEIEEERQDKLRIVSKKNAEVAYFKSELDALLKEMKNTMAKKQFSHTKNSQSHQ